MDDFTKQSPVKLRLKSIPWLFPNQNHYDIIFVDKEIVLVEVGEQHNKRIDFFFKTEKDWENRQRYRENATC